MTRPWVVVLGGGEDQVESYRAAQRLGYLVAGIDQRADALGAGVADRFLALTTRDVGAILAEVSQLDVRAVLAPASDAAQATATELRTRLRVPGQTTERSLACTTDKVAFRALLEELGLPTYASASGDDPDRLAFEAAAVGRSVVVKPVDSSGSKGVTLVRDGVGLRAAVDHAMSQSFTGRAIVEREVVGEHGSVEAFLIDGDLAFLAATKRETSGPPHLVSTAHVLDTHHDVGPLPRMISQICAAIGHRDGPVNLDYVVEPDGVVRLIEFAARLGGNGLPMLVREAAGVDTVTASLRLALGEHVRIVPDRRRAACLEILHTERVGRLRAVVGVDEVAAHPATVAFKIFVRPGEEVRGYQRAGDKLGYLVLAAADATQLAAARHHAASHLRFVVESAELGAVAEPSLPVEAEVS